LPPLTTPYGIPYLLMGVRKRTVVVLQKMQSSLGWHSDDKGKAIVKQETDMANGFIVVELKAENVAEKTK